MIVADANLIAYLCIPGPLSADARAALLKDPNWIAPSLWRSEMMSALLIHVRKAGLTLSEAEEAYDKADKVVTTVEFNASFVRSILEAAGRTQCSAYDSEYVALAESRKLKLVTHDGGVLKKCPGVAVSIADFLAA